MLMFKKRIPKFSFITIVTDAAVVTGAYCFAYWLRFESQAVPIRDIPGFLEYGKALWVIVPVFLFMFKANHLYSVRSPLSRIDEFFAVIKATSTVFLIGMAVTFVYRDFTYSRIVIVVTWALSIAGNLFARNLIRIAERKERKEKGQQTKLLIIGINRNARKLIKRFQEMQRSGYQVVGVLSETALEGEKHLEGVPVLGSVDSFDEIVNDYQIREVILADPDFSRERTAEIMLKCESRMMGFKLVADFYGLVTSRVDIEYVSDVPLLGLKELPLDDVWNRAAKRLFDAFLSACGLLACSPLLAVIALAVKSHDRGPVLYKQERVGEDGKVFNLLKFRTMKCDAEAATGPVWARENDERVTALGKILRRTNLDELPQLWNVLAGDMSLVGPRPERPHFVDQFKEEVPRYMARHKIKSGITGWAQVNGLRGNTSLKERIKYDLYYVENWSLLLDIKILLMTFMAYKNAY